LESRWAINISSYIKTVFIPRFRKKILSAILLRSIHTTYISTELHIIMFQSVDRCHMVWLNLQLTLPDLRKGCVPRNFKQVKLYASRDFSNYNLIQFFLTREEKIKKSASKFRLQ
jgi:hypothetical protein